MPLDLVEKILDEIASEVFRSKDSVTRMSISENGDAFLNPNFIDIVRTIKRIAPWIAVTISANFQHFTKDKAEILLGEKLIDAFHCSIDASTEANSIAVGGLGIDRLRRNIEDFLTVRRDVKSCTPLTVSVLTLETYVSTVNETLGLTPAKFEGDLSDYSRNEYPRLRDAWSRFLDPEIDTILECPTIGFWAERGQIDTNSIDYASCSCPLMDRVRHEAFIAPDGRWYACCLDDMNFHVMGNVALQLLDSVFESPVRKTFIAGLENKAFARLGGPCATVNCCQGISRGNKIDLMKKAAPI